MLTKDEDRKNSQETRCGNSAILDKDDAKNIYSALSEKANYKEWDILRNINSIRAILYGVDRAYRDELEESAKNTILMVVEDGNFPFKGKKPFAFLILGYYCRRTYLDYLTKKYSKTGALLKNDFLIKKYPTKYMPDGNGMDQRSEEAIKKYFPSDDYLIDIGTLRRRSYRLLEKKEMKIFTVEEIYITRSDLIRKIIANWVYSGSLYEHDNKDILQMVQLDLTEKILQGKYNPYANKKFFYHRCIDSVRKIWTERSVPAPRYVDQFFKEKNDSKTDQTKQQVNELISMYGYYKGRLKSKQASWTTVGQEGVVSSAQDENGSYLTKHVDTVDPRLRTKIYFVIKEFIEASNHGKKAKKAMLLSYEGYRIEEIASRVNMSNGWVSKIVSLKQGKEPSLFKQTLVSLFEQYPELINLIEELGECPFRKNV